MDISMDIHIHGKPGTVVLLIYLDYYRIYSASLFHTYALRNLFLLPYF